MSALAHACELPDMFDAQHVEFSGGQSERAIGSYVACPRNYFVSRVHARADSSSTRVAAAATLAVVTWVMQRWSIGHSRSRHGLHSACSRTTVARGPVGPVAASSVAPNTATVGTASAEAMCM